MEKEKTFDTILEAVAWVDHLCVAFPVNFVQIRSKRVLHSDGSPFSSRALTVRFVAEVRSA